MNAKAMEPFGKALIAYAEGDSGAELLMRRDDGLEAAVPVSHFFREEPDFSELERRALELCAGRVLDIGAGAGSLSVALQRRGHSVTAMDISPEAVAVTKRRGVADAVCADIFAYEGGPFDTLLMMGHGIGMVETIEGLKRFLARAHSLLPPNGRIILDSLDVHVTDDARHLAYHEANRKAGRYIGEIRMQIAFKGRMGPCYSWLQVDAETLREHAEEAAWSCDVVHRAEHGDYLARLLKRSAAKQTEEDERL